MKQVVLLFTVVLLVFGAILAQPNFDPGKEDNVPVLDPDGKEDPKKDVPDYWLPENFTVYVRGNIVVNTPYEGFSAKVLPTKNLFKGGTGCYVACYSHNKDAAIYGVGGNIYVMGQMRVEGEYIGRICHPKGFRNKDISAAQKFKFLCSRSLSESCRGGCWAGGDTGGWFGIQ
ncbi:MAG: hypothetical protein KDK45_09525 [Leptospiraceae bacterium]|nr:hypothetical protein [Leptospiraceae bacterium]